MLICRPGNSLIDILYFFSNSAWTIPDMYNLVRESMDNLTPEVILLGQVFDIKGWLAPYINQIDGITAGHHFR